jgi:predicted SprT family Zn-dependent metalloprotease
MMQEIQPSGPPRWSDEALIEAAQRCANVYSRLANKRIGCALPVPANLTFDLCNRKPKAGGEAGRDLTLSINLVLFRDYVDEFLNIVIPHECAHLMQFDKFDNKGFPSRGHGPEWKEAMRRIGQRPEKFMPKHIDVSKAVAHYKATKKTTKRVKKVVEED